MRELQKESEYYQTLRGHKKEHMLIFMRAMQSNLLYENNQHIYINGIFYSAPKYSYKIVTIRINNIKEDIFHTETYWVLTDKTLIHI